jgi:hypothetical protein
MTINPRRLISVPSSSNQLTFDDFEEFVDTETLGLICDDQDDNMGDEAFINIDNDAYA